MIRQVRRRLYHAPGVARGAGAPAHAGEGDDEVVAAIIDLGGWCNPQLDRDVTPAAQHANYSWSIFDSDRDSVTCTMRGFTGSEL